MGFVQYILKTLARHENNLTFAFMMTFAVILVGYSFMISHNIVESSTNYLSLHTIMLVLSFVLAFVVSYFMLKSFGQERHVQFYAGEEIILKSISDKTYAALVSMGDQDVNIVPVHSNIYLTNMGLVVEPKGSGEIALFVPRDMIRDFRPHQNGISVRYIDIKGVYTEVLLIVDDRQAFLEEIVKLTTGNFI
ncbi:MAG: hypothetical protein KKD39_05180 [Candidatus Altiarchaeota archaeon]|nr:hypothetical protein [Candidatus Altiarchaeota archaeon]